MGLWWFCFIQWPLFMLYILSGARKFFSCEAESFVCKLDSFYAIYMMAFAPFMLLPVILSIILAIRRKRGKSISKLEETLAASAWTISLIVSILLAITGSWPS
jgi:hypothetical protein